MPRFLRNTTHLCGDQPFEGACPRCGEPALVSGLGYFPPECTNCGWEAIEGPEELS